MSAEQGSGNGGAEKKNFSLESIREHPRIVGAGVALGLVVMTGLGIRGYVNAEADSRVEVMQLSNRIEAGALESYGNGEGGSVSIEPRNVMFAEGAQFYTAPLEISDSRFLGLVENDNSVTAVGANEVLTSEVAYTMTGEGGELWIGVHASEDITESIGQAGLENTLLVREESDDNTESETDDESRLDNIVDTGSGSIEFNLDSVVWAPVRPNEEGNPTVYVANTEGAKGDTNVTGIDVSSADQVTVTGENLDAIAGLRKREMNVDEILSFIDDFMGREAITAYQTQN